MTKAELLPPEGGLDLWVRLVRGYLMPGEAEELLGEQLWLIDGLSSGRDLEPGSMVRAIDVNIPELEGWIRFHRPDLLEFFEAAIVVAKAGGFEPRFKVDGTQTGRMSSSSPFNPRPHQHPVRRKP